MIRAQRLSRCFKSCFLKWQVYPSARGQLLVSAEARDVVRENRGAFGMPNSSVDRTMNAIAAANASSSRFDVVECLGDSRFHRSEYGRISQSQIIVGTSEN